jgi:hypothetical protein
MSTYKQIYRHDIAEILLKVALNTITLAPYPLTNKSNGLAKIKYLEYVNFITQRWQQQSWLMFDKDKNIIWYSSCKKNVNDYIGSCKSNYHTTTATTAPETIIEHLEEFISLLH